MSCCVCGEAAVPTWIVCSASQQHVTCDDCLRGLVSAVLGSDSIRNARGCVACPYRGAVGAGRVEVCDSRPWDLVALTPHLDRTTAAAVAAAAVSALNVADAEAARVRAELGAGQPATAAPAGDGGGQAANFLPRHERFEAYRRDLIESTLTLKCPRCSAAFTDYEGCDSLTCSNPQCGAFFCALCFALFNTSVAAHAHVASAEHHHDGFRGLHGGIERFRAFHSGRQVATLRTRIDLLQEDEVFKNELYHRLLLDGELQGVAPRAVELAPGGENTEGGRWLGNFGLIAAELLGPRGEQHNPIVRGLQGLVDLAPLVIGAAGVVREFFAPGAQQRRAAGAAPDPRSTLAVPMFAAAASAFLVGGLTWLLRAPRATSPDHPDARALEALLGRPLTDDELQQPPEDLRAMRDALLR